MARTYTALLLSVVWPFIFLHPRLGSAFLQFEPGNNLLFTSEGRGEEREFLVKVQSRGTVPVTLKVENKSCDCLGVRLDRATLRPGESARLVIKMSVPQVGRAHGALTLRTEGEGGEGEYSGLHLFRFAVQGVQGRVLEVIPARMEISKEESSRGVRRVFSLSYRGDQVPTGVQAIIGETPASFVSTQPWQRTNSDLFACVGTFIFEGAMLEQGGEHSIRLSVETESGEHTAEIPVALQGERR
jgi:hypothetical protein